MARIKLIVDPLSVTCFEQPWIRPLIEDLFDLVEYDPASTYTLNDFIFATYQRELEPEPWYRPLREQGLRLIVDHVWDGDVDRTTEFGTDRMELRNGNWIWYHSSIEWHHHGYHTYTPNRAYKHSFFMPINKQRQHRDDTVRRLEPLLQDALYSYVARGRELAFNNPGTPAPWVSQFDPAWYDSTPYSIVVESYMRTRYWAANPHNYKTEISEKSFKPIAHAHPFIIVGSADTIKYLQREGFVTYDNLWSESYDAVVEDRDRLAAVLSLVESVVEQYDYRDFTLDAETQGRIRHNRNHFFDQDLVQRRFRQEIVGDVREFTAA